MENLPRRSLFLKVNLGLLFLVAALITHNSFACYSPIPSHGPRLLRAKALFGAVVRDCHKEILYICQKLPPTMLKQYLDCLQRALTNKSADAYIVDEIPYVPGKGTLGLLTCFRERYGNTSLETVTDSRAYMMKVINEFGWM